MQSNQLEEWSKMKVHKKPGRKGTDKLFYEAVLSNLINAKV